MRTALFSTDIDWSRFRLTRLRIFIISIAMLIIVISVSVVQFSKAENFILSGGAAIGGDFVVFHTAARAMAEGEASSLYDREVFEKKLQEYGPPKERFGLSWQYPPTYFFVIAPLALLGFIPGYIAWTGGSAAVYFAVMRGAGLRGLFLLVLLAAPSTFHAAITGQNGFLTAALIAVATLYADKRPVVAGLAAALLTVKPQLGLLLPIAYVAGGCWRAFFTAALGAIALFIASIFAFGPDIWAAFFSGARGISDLLARGVMPLYKMATPFAAMRLLGLPIAAAGLIHMLVAAGAAATVALVWRRLRDPDLRAAALSACVFLVAPYGFYYELIILALPAAVLARRALARGWLRYEQAALTLVISLPLFLPGDAHKHGLSLGLFIVAILAASVIRRIAHDHPETFRFASARPRPL